MLMCSLAFFSLELGPMAMDNHVFGVAMGEVLLLVMVLNFASILDHNLIILNGGVRCY